MLLDTELILSNGFPMTTSIDSLDSLVIDAVKTATVYPHTFFAFHSSSRFTNLHTSALVACTDDLLGVTVVV